VLTGILLAEPDGVVVKVRRRGLSNAGWQPSGQGKILSEVAKAPRLGVDGVITVVCKLTAASTATGRAVRPVPELSPAARRMRPRCRARPRRLG